MKGKSNAVRIYEVLAEISEPHPLPLSAQAAFSKALGHYFNGEFDQALELFKSKELQDDTAKDEFIKRCKYLTQDSAPEWTGIWKMTTK